MRWIAIFAVLALSQVPARANERAVHLKQAPGVDVVEGQCGACHSLDYIPMNSPFLDAAHWDKEVSQDDQRVWRANRSGRRQNHRGLSQAELWGLIPRLENASNLC